MGRSRIPAERASLIDNPRYRQALINGIPKGLIEAAEHQPGSDEGQGRRVDTVDTVHVGIPYAAAEGELSDADPEKVAGGKQDIKASCDLKATPHSGNEQHGHQRTPLSRNDGQDHHTRDPSPGGRVGPFPDGREATLPFLRSVGFPSRIT